MILFAINSGLRDENICGLRWSWETPIPEAGRSVFIIPSGDYKTAINHVVILNDDAWHIIEQQRAKINKEDGSAKYVFTYSGHRVDTMNNNGWQNARAKAGLQDVRIHDLRHTYASRLRLAGVPQEDRNALMGHKSASIPEHYASADIGRLIELSNKVLDRQGTRTLLRDVYKRQHWSRCIVSMSNTRPTLQDLTAAGYEITSQATLDQQRHEPLFCGHAIK